MNTKNLVIIFSIYLLWCCACVKPYTPVTTTTNYNYLVVEGLINLTDSTFIKLSRTVTVSSASAVKPELKATITIETNTGASYPLKETGNGNYFAPVLNLSATGQYRLRIKTAGGGTYLSDFTQAMTSPPIDTLTWQATDNLQIFLSTHDAKNATWYYRWNFSEEWEFNSNYYSSYVSNGLTIVPRSPAQQIYHCYGGDTSNLIGLGTSAKLSQDVISNQLITTVNSSAEKLGIKYSIKVNQYGLTKDAYDYWTLLKTNTQNLGSIFDAQPSASIGNIHNVNNAAEPVIGYISAGTITSKRIFITKPQMPGDWRTTPTFSPSQCPIDTVPFVLLAKCKCTNPDTIAFPQYQYIDYLRSQYQGYGNRLIPLSVLGTPTINQNPTYLAGAPICVDCTLRGSANKPAYWQ